MSPLTLLMAPQWGVRPSESDDFCTHIVADGVGVLDGPGQQTPHTYGSVFPAHSALHLHFIRGRSDSSPSTSRPARRRTPLNKTDRVPPFATQTRGNAEEAH